VRNFKITYLPLYLFIFLLFSSVVQAEKKGEWKLINFYNYQNISFAPDANGASFLLSYRIPREWALRAQFKYIDKFGDSAPSFGLGGTYWLGENTNASLDITAAPNQIVVPVHSYRLNFNQIFFKKLVLGFTYKFAEYQVANVNMFSPDISWYFHKHFFFNVKYTASTTRIGGRSALDHSFSGKLYWTPKDEILAGIGYARTNEAFDSGNAAIPLGGFGANHYLASLSWNFYKNLGFEFGFDYEDRSNGTHTMTVDSGISIKW
jgi:YaiO family outer membrane protein